MASSMWLNYELTTQYWHLVEKAGNTVKMLTTMGLKLNHMRYFLIIMVTYDCFLLFCGLHIKNRAIRLSFMKQMVVFVLNPNFVISL